MLFDMMALPNTISVSSILCRSRITCTFRVHRTPFATTSRFSSVGWVEQQRYRSTAKFWHRDNG